MSWKQKYLTAVFLLLLTFEVEGQGFGMEIDLENVDWKVLKFTGTAKAFKKTFNDAFIRKFGHYLK